MKRSLNCNPLALCLTLLCLLAHGAAHANDAVKSVSLMAAGSVYNDADSSDDQQIIDVNISTFFPIEQIDHLGVFLDGDYERSKHETTRPPLPMCSVSYTRSLGAGVFLRDAELGGIGIKVTRSSSDLSAKLLSMPSINVKDQWLSTRKDIRGEYYFESLSISGNYSHTDEANGLNEISRGVGLTWYPNNTLLVSTEISREDNRNTQFTTLSAQAEWQPELANILLYAAYFNSPKMDENGVSIGANYYFDAASTSLTNALAIGLNYAHTNTALGSSNLIGVNFGLFFDNHIDLKTRDRSYVFRFDGI